MKRVTHDLGDFSIIPETEEVFCVLPPFLVKDYKKQKNYPWFFRNNKVFGSMNWLLEMVGENAPSEYDLMLKKKAEVLEKYRSLKPHIIQA